MKIAFGHFAAALALSGRNSAATPPQAQVPQNQVQVDCRGLARVAMDDYSSTMTQELALELLRAHHASTQRQTERR
jgi:hypothetical protein